MFITFFCWRIFLWLCWVCFKFHFNNFVLFCHGWLTVESCVCIFHVFWNCRWVDAPPCDGCGSKTISHGMGSPLPSEIQYGASRVELYMYDYRICLFLSSDFSVWLFNFSFCFISGLIWAYMYTSFMFPSTLSLTTYQKLMDFRSGTGTSNWVTMCFSFFAGVGWGGMGLGEYHVQSLYWGILMSDVGVLLLVFWCSFEWHIYVSYYS